MSAPTFIIRSATPQDIPVILRFITELADYEKLRHEVVATEAALQHSLFGERPYAEVVLALEADIPVGFALFFHNYSTFLAQPGIYLEDLFVLSEHRGKGYGEALLRYLAQLAVSRSCGRLEWSVLDWNEPAISFYKKLGAVSMDEWTTFRVTGEHLKQLSASLTD
ncbi:MAG: GNAT family N-acetyltransferase [Rhodothermia bacterium]|nr:GNAT family N-acetyltransferase [Rhodothermia bacterium]